MNGVFAAFGDRALRFAIPSEADRRQLLAALRACPGVVDVVLAEDVGAVVLEAGASLGAAARALAPAAAGAAASTPGEARAPTVHAIRVVYDGPDLAEIAASLGVSTDAVVAMHASGDYEVAMLGFVPGFAYLRGLDPRLVLPRRAQPRPRVPAGSVGVAAEYTGVYPSASPGGWNLVGRAIDHRAFDGQGATLAVGDRVRFERDDRDDGLGPSAAATPAGADAQPSPPGPHLEVRKAYGLALVVDGGRPGHMHEGVPHGGPMVARALAAANAVAGNASSTAGIEILGLLEVAARGGRVLVATDGAEHPVDLAEGETLVVGTEGKARVRYLAVRGGVDVPVVLGGRGTLLAAGLGGHRGRKLERGDIVAPGARAEARPARAPDHEVASGALRGASGVADAGGGRILQVEAIAGPDADDAIARAIERETFTIGPASDRVGTRLEGPALPAHPIDRAHEGHKRTSTPMILGAIEMTRSGLVVLGPDHPTTGGYPVVAVVSSAALDSLFARPVGAPVRFRIAPAPRALA